MPWIVSETAYLLIEIALVALAGVSAMLAADRWGIQIGVVVVVAFAILIPSRVLILQTHTKAKLTELPYIKNMTQQEYDSIESKDANTLYIIIP